MPQHVFDCWCSCTVRVGPRRSIVLLVAAAILLSFFAGAAFSAGGYADSVTTDGPEAYWRLQEASGAVSVADASGNGHVGTPTNVSFGVSSPITTDTSDTAISLSGNGYVETSASTSFKGATGFTVEAWVYPTAAGYAAIASDRSSPGSGWWVGLNGGSTQLEAIFPPYFSISSANLPQNQWSDVAAVYDPAGGTKVRLYINGAEAGYAYRDASTGSGLTDTGPVRIGETPDGNHGFHGRLDEVALYNKAVSGTRIAAHYGAATPVAPSNTTLPSISGNALEGQTLSADNGSWTGSPTSYAYQWRRCDSAGASCADISGASGSNYTLVSADVGATVRVLVTATNAGGSGSAASAATEVVTATNAPQNTAAPQISGTVVAGDTLKASTGSWTGNPTNYSYQWSRCDGAGANCSEIDHATDSRLLLSAEDVGHKFKAQVTASNDAGSTPTSSPSSDSTAAGAPSGSWAPIPSGAEIIGDPYYSGYHWTWRPPGSSTLLPDGGWVFELEGGTGVDNDRFYHCRWIGNPLYANTCEENADMREHAFRLAREYGGGLTETSTSNCSPFPAYPMACFQSLKLPNGFLPGEDSGQCVGAGKHRVCVDKQISDPIHGATGDYVNSVTDLRLAALGVPFELARTYNSTDQHSGLLGHGWSVNLDVAVSFPDSLHFSVTGEDGARLVYKRGVSTGAPGVRSLLTPEGSGYELVSRDQTHYHFDAAGKLTSEVDRNGQGLSFSYVAGQLANVTDSAQRVVSLGYNADGLLANATLPDGRAVTYGYTAGNLTSVTDPRGKTTTYSYDADGNLLTEVDPNGHTVVTNTYGEDGRISSQTDARGKTTSFAWDPSTQTETSTDARGNAWKDVYSGGVLVKRVDPFGNTTQYGHDAYLNLTSEQDARGNTTTMTYDSRGNLLTRTAPAPLSYQQVFTYDSKNDLLTDQDGRGNTTSLGYDAAGNLTSVTRPGSIVTQYGRDASGTGLLASITDPRGKTTSFTHDSAGNLTSVTTALGFTTTLGYDSSGRLTSSVDPRGNVMGANPDDYRTTYAYNNADQLTSLTDPLGHSWSYDYDPAGNRTSITDPNSHVTTYAYDASNRLASVTAPGGAATSYGYDPVGNLTGRTDPNDHTTSYTYDAANRLSSLVTAAGQTWTYDYDPDGNLKTMIDANGNAPGAPPGSGTTTYGYDVLNRLTSIGYSDSTPSVTFGYNANGSRTAMTDGAGSQSYGYDALNRLTDVTRGSDTFAYGYDVAGNLLQETYPGGRVINNTYDDDGHLATVASNSLTTSYGYDAAGELTRTDYPSGNGYSEIRAYDRAGRLSSVENVNGGSTISSFAYDYDAAGNPTQVTTVDGVVTYGYDARDRLTSVCYQASCPNGSDPFIDYAYDGVSNRTSETRPAGATTYSYNSADELTSTSGPGGTTSFDYDQNGNEIAAGSRTFTYDLANRTVSTTSAGTTIDFSYDGDGNRLQASGDGSTTNYLWDVNHPLAQLGLERDASNSVIRSYERGADLVSMDAGGQTYYFHRDGLGSITNVTSASGQAEWTYSYEPFGDSRATTQNDPAAPDNPIRFAGEMVDPHTSLYDLRARQYDATTGRFLGRDPLAAPQTRPYVSSYLYADGRPSVLTDPSGMGPVWGPGDKCAQWRNMFNPACMPWRTIGKCEAGVAIAGAALVTPALAIGPVAGEIGAGEGLWGIWQSVAGLRDVGFISAVSAAGVGVGTFVCLG